MSLNNKQQRTLIQSYLSWRPRWWNGRRERRRERANTRRLRVIGSCRRRSVTHAHDGTSLERKREEHGRRMLEHWPRRTSRTWIATPVSTRAERALLISLMLISTLQIVMDFHNIIGSKNSIPLNCRKHYRIIGV